jgi:IS30 family transposase
MARMPVEERLELRRLYWAGVSDAEITSRIGCHKSEISRLMLQFPWKPRKRSPRNLALSEREDISLGLSAGKSMQQIGRELGRPASTISREVAASKDRFGRYRAYLGEERAERLMTRPKPKKLASAPALRRVVEEKLQERWSPGQIAKRLRLDYPNDLSMRISPETIYQSLYVQGRGSLRKELTNHLRQRRPKRQAQSRQVVPRSLRDMVNISERPAEVADRAVPGHWEGDLIIGKNQGSAIGTLVERSTRYVMLLHLPRGRTAEHVREALTKKILTLPAALRRSLTWDQGKELAQHAQFTVDTGVKVFFCDPHSPWQRGSNENTNGLLRQYFPKSTDLNQFDEAHLDKVALELNGRPRETLAWLKPSEKLNELLKAA